MKISKLLATYQQILQQARMANLAQAYVSLGRFALRVQHARLEGLVTLRQPNADEGLLWASLTALEGSQAVIEEHFCDEDLMEFADAVAFQRGVDNLEITFRLEKIMSEFVIPLKVQLEQAGVDLEGSAPPSDASGSSLPRESPVSRRRDNGTE